ncbi:monocarboxylate transporter 12-like [Amphiura filiformis]|uniref:monocarboxylate transporter 12-like n=1 Tax=Amphiura filiformis TaxID=82378 RepID=UPI003B228630
MGVFYMEWKKAFGEDLHGDGSSTIGLLASSVIWVMLTTAPISGALSHHFGVRPVVMLGGLLSAVCLFISSFADTIHLLYFTVPMTVYIKERATVVGISDYNATLLISTIGISGLVAQAGHGRLIDKKICHTTTLYAFANFLTAVSLPLIAVSEQYAVFVICAANIGFAAGLYIAINIVIVRGIVGVHRFPGGIGLTLFVLATSIMSTVLLAGLLLDYTGDYMAGFLYASIMQGLCGVWVLVSHVVWTKCVKDPRWPPSLPPVCHIGPKEAAEPPKNIVRNKELEE